MFHAITEYSNGREIRCIAVALENYFPIPCKVSCLYAYAHGHKEWENNFPMQLQYTVNNGESRNPCMDHASKSRKRSNACEICCKKLLLHSQPGAQTVPMATLLLNKNGRQK